MMYVIDSPLPLKLLLQETDSDKAATLLAHCRDEGGTLGAPDILLYEATNGLLRKKKMSVTAVEMAIELMMDTGIQLRVADAEFIRRAVDIAGRTGTSVYDASYVALAAEENGILVTADEKLSDRRGSAADIRLLSSL